MQIYTIVNLKWYHKLELHKIIKDYPAGDARAWRPNKQIVIMLTHNPLWLML